MIDVQERYKYVLEWAKREAKRGLNGYFRHLIVDSVPPQRFTSIVEPWQQTIYDFLTPLYEVACGLRLADPDEPRACFVTAGRGASKTSTIAQFNNWALNFSKHHVEIVVGAADQEQANILLKRMKLEAQHNPCIDLEFRHYRITGPTGICEIVSSEAGTSAGRGDHITVVDELVWHAKPDLWQLLSTGGYIKRKDGVLIVLTNSGIQGSWQHTLWKAAKNSDEWISYDVPAFAPSWLDRKKIEEQRKTLLPSFFARLFENRWINENEENAYLTREQVEACQDYTQQHEGKAYYHVCGIDAAFVHDRTVACICHAEGEDVFLDAMQVWEGSKDARMQIAELEAWFEAKLQAFRVKRLVLDNTQLEAFSQKYEGRLQVERFSFNGQHKRLGETLRSLITSKRLHLYKNAGPLKLKDGMTETLLDELSSLIVEESAGGNWRVNHVEGKHDDRYSALAMCVSECVTSRTANPVTFMDNLTILFNTKKEETDMEFQEVKTYAAYGTFIPRPILNGLTVKLNDYPNAKQAAFAVNVAHELTGSVAPNKVQLMKKVGNTEVPDTEKTAEIRQQVEKQLRERKLITDKKKEKVK